MKNLKDNSGMTLVEIVISILILGIASMMLASGFSSAARMTNRATDFRNASVATSSSLELEEAYQGEYSTNDISYVRDDTSGDFEITYIKDSTKSVIHQKGKFSSAKENNTGLTYSEYMPTANSYDVPAVSN